MKQFELNGKTILAIPIPLKISMENIFVRNVFGKDMLVIIGSNSLWLPFKGCKFLCLSKDMTEELAKSLVEFFQITRVEIGGYKDYVNSNNEIEDFTFHTALESFRSFEQSVGIVSVNPYEKSDECTCHICSEYCNWCEDDFDGIEYNEVQNEVKNYAILIKE